MTEVNYADFYKSALAEAGAGAENLPNGEYEIKIVSRKISPASANRKMQAGIQLLVTAGAYAGKRTWINQSFNPENPKAIAVYLSIVQKLGCPAEAVASGEPPERLAEYIAVGTLGVADLTSTSGTKPNADGSPKMFQNLTNFRITGFEAPTSTPTAPGGVIPTVPGALPTPMPLPVPVMSVPVQAPVTVPQPAPPQAVGTVPPAEMPAVPLNF